MGNTSTHDHTHFAVPNGYIATQQNRQKFGSLKPFVNHNDIGKNRANSLVSINPPKNVGPNSSYPRVKDIGKITGFPIKNKETGKGKNGYMSTKTVGPNSSYPKVKENNKSSFSQSTMNNKGPGKNKSNALVLSKPARDVFSNSSNTKVKGTNNNNLSKPSVSNGAYTNQTNGLVPEKPARDIHPTSPKGNNKNNSLKPPVNKDVNINRFNLLPSDVQENAVCMNSSNPKAKAKNKTNASQSSINRKDAGKNFPNNNQNSATPVQKPKKSSKGPLPPRSVLAIDCEMVGTGPKGNESMLARVSIVNRGGKVLLDKFVKPNQPVTDYRTEISGIRPTDIKNGEDFEKIQDEVVDILQGKILVGHALHHDLAALSIRHPNVFIRDTSKFSPITRVVSGGRTPSLKALSREILKKDIQNGEHNSVEDARAAMGIYNKYSSKWEQSLKRVK